MLLSPTLETSMLLLMFSSKSSPINLFAQHILQDPSFRVSYSILDLFSPYLILKIAQTLNFDISCLIDICPNGEIKSLYLNYFQ
jgi:hypothetical protein